MIRFTREGATFQPEPERDTVATLSTFRPIEPEPELDPVAPAPAPEPDPVVNGPEPGPTTSLFTRIRETVTGPTSTVAPRDPEPELPTREVTSILPDQEPPTRQDVMPPALPVTEGDADRGTAPVRETERAPEPLVDPVETSLPVTVAEPGPTAQETTGGGVRTGGCATCGDKLAGAAGASGTGAELAPIAADTGAMTAADSEAGGCPLCPLFLAGAGLLVVLILWKAMS
jgi:hypothetical protein